MNDGISFLRTWALDPLVLKLDSLLVAIHQSPRHHVREAVVSPREHASPRRTRITSKNTHHLEEHASLRRKRITSRSRITSKNTQALCMQGTTSLASVDSGTWG
jgi:hypothetical protein